MAAKKRKLTAKQNLFIKEYLVDLNAAGAARRAGYKGNDKTLSAVGSENLAKPRIAAEVQKAVLDRSDRTGITADRVVKELELLAFSDVKHYVIDDDGCVQAAEGAPEGVTRALSSLKRKVTFTKEGERVIETEVKLWNKPDPLKLAGRHTSVKGFSDRVEHTGKDGQPVQIAAGVTQEVIDKIHAKILGLEKPEGDAE